MIILCTCFDKGYLDKGLVLYHSLKRNCTSFKLYIFCFDTSSRDVLSKEKLESAVICDWSDYESPELLRIKQERTRAEYYWTCTPQIIKIVLERFNEEHCIYIDADLAFFSDPIILLEEIQDSGGHVGIMEHRFNKGIAGKRYLRRSGKYCVEFNYFDQNSESKKALNWWADRCMEWCYHIREPERMGDQKYLMKFEELFEGTYVFKNLGAGLAPWNSRQYKVQNDGNKARFIHINSDKSTEDVQLVFYHFQNINFISSSLVNLSTGTSDVDFCKAVYYPYIYAILQSRLYLTEKGISFNNERIYSSNVFLRVWQRFFLKYKFRSVTDFVFTNKIIEYITEDTSRDVLW